MTPVCGGSQGSDRRRRGGRRRLVRPLVGALLGVLLLASAGCSGTLHGRVLDAETGEPIAGAVVLGVRTKRTGFPGLQYAVLVDVKETETNAQGRFALERPVARRDEDAVTIYKFGYVAWSNLYTFFPPSNLHDDTRVPSTIALQKFPDGQSHWRHMDFISGARRSGYYGLDEIPKFWDALQQENQIGLEEYRRGQQQRPIQ